jgi:selenocysteine-specific elongation factor
VPERPLLHVGAASASAHFRPLGAGLGRLSLDRPLPLRIGDRALLRDPGSRRLWGLTVLDPAPPPLHRRGAASVRAAELDRLDGEPDLTHEVARRGIVRRSLLRRIGVDTAPLDTAPLDTAPLGPVPDWLAAGDWVLGVRRAADLRERLRLIVEEHDRAEPLDLGVPVAGAAQALELPHPDLVAALVTDPLRLEEGRVTRRRDGVLPAHLERALGTLHGELVDAPFAAPTSDRLEELGLDARAVAAAARAGRLLRVADGIVLLPGADRLAATQLAELPQPFTTSEARIRLGTSRRVALPLLAHLDRLGLTRRLADDRRTVRSR